MSERRCVLVTSPTGTGKTQMVLRELRDLVKRDYARVLVVGPNQNNVSVWVEELHQMIVLENDTSRYQRRSLGQMELELADHGYTCPVTTSLRNLPHIPRRARFDAIVFDEWHRIGVAAFTRNALRRLAQTTRVAVFVSATPINPVRELGLLEEGPGARDLDYEELLDQGTAEALHKITGFYGLRYDQGLALDDPFDKLVRAVLPGIAFEMKSTEARWRVPTAWRNMVTEISEFAFWKKGRGLAFIREATFEQEYYYVNHIVATRESRGAFRISGKSPSAFSHRYSPKRMHRVLDRSKAGASATRWLAQNSDKCRILARVLIALHDENAKAKVIVFCIHKGTARGLFEFLKRELPPHLARELIEGYRVSSKKLKREFNETDEGRFLIATDSLSESLSLHKKCDYLVHYELPWSPLRLIQRVGRITRLKDDDRRTKAAFTAHLIVPGSAEEERVNRLLRRFEILRKRRLLPSKMDSVGYARFIAGVFGQGPSLVLRRYLPEPKG